MRDKPAENSWTEACGDGDRSSHAAVPRRALARESTCLLWNVLILFAAVSIVFAIGEVTLRLTWSFLAPVQLRYEFVPGVGMHSKPHSELRWTNTFDYWTVSHTNSLGFLDREPPTAERAASSCHVAIVGDSFVEASQVPIADKVQVRLERLAAERLADWDVTTAAYGLSGTGQVQQLPWWNKWIRHRRPKLVVLVTIDNDFINNASPMQRYSHARLAEDGGITLAPPAITRWWRTGRRTWASSRITRASPEGWSLYQACCHLGMQSLRFVWDIVPPTHSTVWLRTRWAAAARKRLGQTTGEAVSGPGGPPAASGDRALPYDTAFSGFALDQWKEATRQSGAFLVVLATSTIHDRHLSVLKTLTAARRIPVVSQREYIVNRGGALSDAQWPKDSHWSPQGHQWAAEALIEWLAANPAVCRPARG